MNKTKSLTLLASAAVVCGIWFFYQPSRWTDVTLTKPMPSVEPDAQPRLIRTIRLPPFLQLKSPKPVVAADPAGNVMVVAHGLQDDPLGSDVIVWRSEDRGETWGAANNLTQKAQVGETYFDPWLETDRRGRFYMVYGHRSDGRPLVRRSQDSGVTWSAELPIPWGQCDRPVMAVSPSGRTLAIAGSLSEKTASYPSEPLDSNDPNFAKKLQAAFHHYGGIFISRNYGQSWEKLPGPFDGAHAIPFSVIVDDESRISAGWIVEGSGSQSVVTVTEDLGRTWTTMTLVESLQPDRPHPFNGARFPVLAMDGRSDLHVAYITSGATALMTRRSRPDWKNWDAPQLLSSENAQEVRMPAIDACGPMVHVTWMERSGVSDIWQAYYRGSNDYGKTWSSACRLSQRVDPLDLAVVNNSFQLFGDDDQSSVRDDGTGRAHAVWSIRGGSVMHAMIDWLPFQIGDTPLQTPESGTSDKPPVPNQ